MTKRLVYAWAALLLCAAAFADHRVLLQGNGKLAIVEPDGAVSWEMPWGPVHDLHLAGEYIVTTRDFTEVVAIDRATKSVVWTYDSAQSNGNAARKVEVHAVQPLGMETVMIAESGAGRIIEVDRDGRLKKVIQLKLDDPHPHRDTRLARKLKNGHYLVCHEGDGVVREYDADGIAVWEYPVPLFDKPRADGHGPEAFGNQVFGAIRLDNGNTLIATGNGHSVIEVNRDKEIVWALHQNDLPGITLAWVTTLELLPNGNLVIGNCHAGPGQPQLIEIKRDTKEVVWTFARYEDFGNDVSNTLLLDAAGTSLR